MEKKAHETRQNLRENEPGLQDQQELQLQQQLLSLCQALQLHFVADLR